jgi:hypothetical protein
VDGRLVKSLLPPLPDRPLRIGEHRVERPPFDLLALDAERELDIRSVQEVTLTIPIRSLEV